MMIKKNFGIALALCYLFIGCAEDIKRKISWELIFSVEFMVVLNKSIGLSP